MMKMLMLLHIHLYHHHALVLCYRRPLDHHDRGHGLDHCVNRHISHIRFKYDG